MRRAALLPLAVGVLLASAFPALSQGQSRPVPPPGPAQQQRPQQQPAPPPQATPKPYRPVAIGAPPAINDPSFDAFRKQVGEAARRRDRTALARLVVAKNFFWLGQKGDRADKKRSGIDNLTRILSLNAQEGMGWEALAGYAAEPTAMEVPDRKGTLCAPADPVFDLEQLENLAKATDTNGAEWGYPGQPGIEVRASAQPGSPVIERLGMHFVWVLEDDEREPQPGQMPMLRVVVPSGKVGYVPADALSPLGNDQLCYVKDATGWKIGGFVGGDE